MIFLNKKYTLIAFIGLSISLSLVAENLIFLYSYQFDAFNKYVRENPEEQITITPSNMLNSFGKEEVIIPELNGIIDQSLIFANIKDRVISRQWINRRAVLLPFEIQATSAETLFSTTIVGVPNYYFQILQDYLLPGGSMPSATNDMIAIARPARFTEVNLTTGLFNTYVIVNPFNLEQSLWLGIPRFHTWAIPSLLCIYQNRA
jgi:hypothetical protein